MVHHAHQALICKPHGHAITKLARHLADAHSDLDLRSRKEILSGYLGLQTSRPTNANNQFGPRNSLPAINGLTVHNGFACKDYEMCGYLTIGRKAVMWIGTKSIVGRGLRQIRPSLQFLKMLVEGQELREKKSGNITIM